MTALWAMPDTGAAIERLEWGRRTVRLLPVSAQLDVVLDQVDEKQYNLQQLILELTETRSQPG